MTQVLQNLFAALGALAAWSSRSVAWTFADPSRAVASAKLAPLKQWPPHATAQAQGYGHVHSRDWIDVFPNPDRMRWDQSEDVGKSITKPRSQTQFMGAFYIVTDLDLRARFDIAILHAELTRTVDLYGGLTVHRGVWRGNYSSSLRGCRHPAEAVDELLGIVERLGDDARDQWERCICRRFNMGFQGIDERFASMWQIRAPLLQRLAAVNANLVVTMYRPEQPRETT